MGVSSRLDLIHTGTIVHSSQRNQHIGCVPAVLAQDTLEGDRGDRGHTIANMQESLALIALACIVFGRPQCVEFAALAMFCDKIRQVKLCSMMLVFEKEEIIGNTPKEKYPNMAPYITFLKT